MTIHIDYTLCLHCGQCARVCRRFILETTQQGLHIHRNREPSCMHCGHCTAICPVGALTLDEATSRDLPEIRLPAHAEATLDAVLQSRRSIGAFTSRPVPRDTITGAIDKTRYAPAARNQRRVHWLVIDTPEMRHALLENMLPFYRKSSDPISRTHYENHLCGHDSILRGAPCLILAHSPTTDLWTTADCVTAVAHLQLILHVQGLASCWAGGLLRPPSPPCLPIPPQHAINAALMVGYPAVKIRRAPPRPAPLVVFA